MIRFSIPLSLYVLSHRISTRRSKECVLEALCERPLTRTKETLVWRDKIPFYCSQKPQNHSNSIGICFRFQAIYPHFLVENCHLAMNESILAPLKTPLTRTNGTPVQHHSIPFYCGQKPQIRPNSIYIRFCFRFLVIYPNLMAEYRSIAENLQPPRFCHYNRLNIRWGGRNILDFWRIINKTTRYIEYFYRIAMI